MAAKLGIRSCDIAGLNLDDIHGREGIIRLTQQKTNVSIEFPILQEISTALDDYLNNARPDSCLPNLFLTKPRPVASALSTQGIYAIVSGVIAKSGIDVASRRRGAHALRSSLASQLLSDRKTYSEIQQVLGQISPDAARHYVRVETERLRECALKVPDFSDEILLIDESYVYYLYTSILRPTYLPPFINIYTHLLSLTILPSTLSTVPLRLYWRPFNISSTFVVLHLYRYLQPLNVYTIFLL